MDTILNTIRATRRIMVVEDNATVAQDCRDSLESLGYRVTSVVASGEESIERVGVDKPDAVLMDIHLRDAMDGIEASEKIYTQFGIPVVFLSAYSDRELLMRVKHAGAFGYLVKPFNERELYATLEMAFYKVKAEAEREKMIQQLEARSAELERYAYTVSHDLKSPMVTINGFVSMLEKDAYARDLEKMKVDVSHINSATQKMFHLLNDLLEVSKVGRTNNLFVTIRLVELVEEVLELLSISLKEKNVQVKVSPELPVVFGDRQRMGEVFQNLIENAIKYMGNQKKPKIDIGVRQNAGESVIYVRDNGIGINPDYCDNIFGLFNQLDPRQEGTGVGLAIVKRIVELYGGRIWAESEGEGKGTDFWFTLPPNDDGLKTQTPPS